MSNTRSYTGKTKTTKETKQINMNSFLIIHSKIGLVWNCELAHHIGHMGPGDAEFEGEKVNYLPPTPADDSSSDMELSICPTINDGFLNLK